MLFLWRIMGSVFRRMNRDVFLRGFTGWIKVIPVRPEAQDWGLSIVKHGAALHKAKINLDSEPGKGTKMELMF